MKKVISLIVVLATVALSVCVSTSITATLRGDINGDGSINNKDVVILFRYVSAGLPDGYKVIYDFNGDKNIDNKDVVSLFRAVSSGVLPTDEITEETETEPEETEPDTTEEETTEAESSVEESEEISEEETTTEEETTEDLGEFIVVPDSEAELYIPRVFGDHMVLQRDQEIKIWGTSNREGALVRGTFMKEEALGKVKDGKWEITFSPKEATTKSQKLLVEDSCGNKIEITDILVGDVYFVGGQSNAKVTISYVHAKPTVDKSTPLRVFHQDENDVINNTEAAKQPCEDTINPTREWKTASRASAYGFSALGWYIGYKLAGETGVPQGFICMAAGAASIAMLMPKELADSFGYKNGVSVIPGEPYIIYPSEHYNGLMHPFLKLKFKAMIFFQGEAEGGTNSVPSSNNYARDFEALMTELRRICGFDFPVYNVQISDYPGEECETNWTHVGEVRTQQYEAYKKMSGVRLIPSYDLGSKSTDLDCAHSPYKEALADRISALILADIYGKGDGAAALSPEPEEITVVSSDKNEKVIEIKFSNVGEGLESLSGDNTVGGFIYGKNEHPYNYTSKEISGTIVSADTVRLTVPAASKYIGYAATMRTADKNDVFKTQLYNSNKLPPLAFFLKID